MIRLRPVPAFVAACMVLAAAFASASPARGQELGLEGRVIDPTGAPVEGLVVGLHSVAGQDGALIAEATSAADGTFSFTLAGVADSAVFFATTRYQGELYVGAPFKLPGPPGAEYVIVVGADPVQIAGSVGVSGPGVPPGRTQGSPLPFIALVGAVGAAILLGLQALRRLRPATDPRREMLLEIALLDERYGGPDAQLEPAAREAYLRRRQSLRARLGTQAAKPRT